MDKDVLKLVSSHQRPKKILWVDLETGGLDERAQPIFEVAAIVTSSCFKPLDQFHKVIFQPQEVIDKMESVARQMLTDNGLIDQLASGEPHQEVENQFLSFIEHHFGSEKARIAGNSVYRDLEFFKVWMPKVADRINHRLLDVSALKTLFQTEYGLEVEKNAPHKAMVDIQLSIKELSSYVQFIQIPEHLLPKKKED